MSAWPPKPKGFKSCDWCGTEFGWHPKGATRFCSIQCSTDWRESRPPLHGPKRPKRPAKSPANPTTSRPCAVCGCEFTPKQQERKAILCSNKCRYEKYAWTKRKNISPFKCKTCGVEVVPTYRNKSAVYCSTVCRKHDPVRRREAKALRRARKAGAVLGRVAIIEVFDRDGWRCQICMKPVARSRSVPHPFAPTLDHIVPLAAGGAHVRENVQLAHFICNSRKGHRGAGQLRLMG